MELMELKSNHEKQPHTKSMSTPLSTHFWPHSVFLFLELILLFTSHLNSLHRHQLLVLLLPLALGQLCPHLEARVLDL